MANQMSNQNLKELSRKILSDTKPEDAFWFSDGVVARNIHELLTDIQSCSDKTFIYHINSDNKKNDFAKWIRNSLGDNELADKLQNVLDREKYIEIIEKRIEQLESV
ncbi:MAG: DUF5752 family protein [archaeon]